MNCFHLYLFYFFSYAMLFFRAFGHCVVAEDWVAGTWGLLESRFMRRVTPQAALEWCD